jgi:hypothetical protein
MYVNGFLLKNSNLQKAGRCAMSQSPATHLEEYQCPLSDLDLVRLYFELAHQFDCIQTKFHLFPLAKQGQNG